VAVIAGQVRRMFVVVDDRQVDEETEHPRTEEIPHAARRY
jgi:hypothetical protein